MMRNDGPINLVFDFADDGAGPPDRPLTRDNASLRGPWPSTKLLLDVREVGEALGCGKTYVYDLIARGELRTVKLGRLTRIPAVALGEFVRRKLEPNPDGVRPRQSPDTPFPGDASRRKREPHAADAPLAQRNRRRRR